MNIAGTKTARPESRAVPHPSLADETRTHVDTACAAYHLNRKPRTLRAWASGELPAPIQPASRLNRRLRWAVSDLRRLLESEGA
jgi:hypothetical protein